MLEIIIRQNGQNDAVGRLQDGVYLLGRERGCQIRLDQNDISPRQLQIVVRSNRVTVMDLGSASGSWLGRRQLFAHEPCEVAFGEELRTGKLVLLFRACADTETSKPSSMESDEKPAASVVKSQEHYETPTAKPEQLPVLAVSGIAPELRPLAQEIKKRAHAELLKRLNLKKLALSAAGEEEVRERARETIGEILSQLTLQLPRQLRLEQIERELIQEATGLGALEYLISLDDITEIMVNGPDRIYIEKQGVLYRTDCAFADAAQVLSAIERIVAPLGRRIDESSPMVDARLPDGSRVNAIIPPLALTGPSITIRKFARQPYKMPDLIKFGSLSAEMAQFLQVCVLLRKNILISGGTGSGKTTLLNVLSSFLPNRERIITIEDAAELQLSQEHLVRLESRPPNIEGRGEITIRDLVRNALRMRPDRIVVGECRGGEALDMLQAMNTGHDGSLTTIHANTPRDALARLETLVLMAGFDLPLRAIREQVASAIDIVVQITRDRDGVRRVTQIGEITKMEGEVISFQELFTFRNEGWGEDNRIKGFHDGSGGVPTFVEEISRAGLDLDLAIFQSQRLGNGR